MIKLIGHAEVLRTFDRAVAERRVSHAYLLHGPPRIGKSTVAHWMALRLLCLSPDSPCGTCRTCRRILEGKHPDARSLQAPSERDPHLGLILEDPNEAQRGGKSVSRVISVDAVRALQRDAALAPSESAWKVYLIIGAESLTTEAANCLLKTLEEPPPHVVLILTTADPFDLLPTILSRCQSVRLSHVASHEIAAALRERGCPDPEATLRARLSGGRPGWALLAEPDEPLRQQRQRILDDLAVSLRRSFRERLGLAERIAASYAKDPSAVLELLAIWQLWWWDVYLLQEGCPDLITNVDQDPALREMAQRVSRTRLRHYLTQLATASQRLLQNVNPRLALEALLVAAPVE